MSEYRLKHPFEFEGQTITEVTVKRLKGKRIIALEREIKALREQRGEPSSEEMPITEIEMSIYEIAGATGLPLEAAEEMDLADITEITKNFLSS